MPRRDGESWEDRFAKMEEIQQEQERNHSALATTVSLVVSRQESLETLVNDSIRGYGPVLAGINDSLAELKKDKIAREAVADALGKSPWGMFKARFAQAGVMFFVGGVWVLIGWSALSLYNSFKGVVP